MPFLGYSKKMKLYSNTPHPRIACYTFSNAQVSPVHYLQQIIHTSRCCCVAVVSTVLFHQTFSSMRSYALLLFLLATVGSFAQTDTSCQLLWYKGKKIKPNILHTPKGDTVRFNPASGELKVISKSGDGKRFDNMFFSYLQYRAIPLSQNPVWVVLPLKKIRKKNLKKPFAYSVSIIKTMRMII